MSHVEPPSTEEKTASLDEVLRDNEGLTRAVQILEDDNSGLEYTGRNSYSASTSDDTILTPADEDDADHEHFADETAFSTFSAVPDMTMFAKIGHSPGKFAAMNQTPRPQSYAGVPSSSRRSTCPDQDDSPTPRKAPVSSSHSVAGEDAGNNTTNLILDFTEQFNTFTSSRQQSPSRSERPFPSKTSSDLLSYTQNARTPSPHKHRNALPAAANRMSHLLDFDIPPAPTPRSMPSITPRELESLKSGFLSEISSLKATLSGREAEVQSLKQAVGDAEKRVGQSMEQVREESTLREQLAIEKEEWEKRAREMEAMLRNVREELVQGERDRESLEGRLQESEMRREMAETMHQEAESKMAGMRAGSAASLNAVTGDTPRPTPGSREVEMAVEKVARELHTLYKGKHETKVAALKRSYEVKWDKKIHDLEGRLEDLIKENEDLRNGAMSNVIPRISEADMQLTADLKAQAASESQHAKELEARLEGLTEEMRTVKEDNNSLRCELERERVEKGELVAACDELLTLQESAPQPSATPLATGGTEHMRGSVFRTSGLRAPGSYGGGVSSGQKSPPGPSRIAKMDRHKSGGSVSSIGSISGLSRPGSGLSMVRSTGIMSSIEKMGSYKGRAVAE